MKNPSPYDRLWSEYDRWFTDHPELYSLELAAVKRLIPSSGRGVEIGVGTGRFAAPLGITMGVEPSPGMGRMAQQRGVKVVRGTAESLPFLSDSIDFILYVTAICFLDDVQKSMDEAFRVLKAGGRIVAGMIDGESRLGIKYSAEREKSRFYRDAVFLTVDEIEMMLKRSGFSLFRFAQTLIHDHESGSITDLVKEGHGEGSFVVITGKKV